MDEPTILHACEQWMVIAKPAGWHTVSKRATDGAVEDPPEHTIESWLRRHHPELAVLEEAGIVHRLDASTSGCLLVARSMAERARLRARISEVGGGIRKIYLAIMRAGVPVEGAFTLHFRGRHRRSAKVTVSDDGEAHEQGSCRWTRLAATADGDLVEVELLGPGRRHQIRAGFAHLGFPLRGDPIYRGDPPINGMNGAALHAWRLRIDREVIEAPLPSAWSQFHSAVSRRTDGASITRPTQTG